jgi:hypothetical protein
MTCPSGKPELPAHQALRQARESARRVMAYRCNLCLAWHVGTRTISKRSNRKRRESYDEYEEE